MAFLPDANWKDVRRQTPAVLYGLMQMGRCLTNYSHIIIFQPEPYATLLLMNVLIQKGVLKLNCNQAIVYSSAAALRLD